MAAGNQPDRGKYGKVVSEALRFVLDQERGGRYPGYLQNPPSAISVCLSSCIILPRMRLFSNPYARIQKLALDFVSSLSQSH